MEYIYGKTLQVTDQFTTCKPAGSHASFLGRAADPLIGFGFPANTGALDKSQNRLVPKPLIEGTADEDSPNLPR